MNTYYRFSYPAQLSLLLMLTGISFIVGSFITIGLAAVIFQIPFLELQAAITTSENAALMRFIQTFSTILGLGVPCFVFARIVSKQPFKQLGFSSSFSLRHVFLVILIAATCLLAGNFFSRINEAIPLSAKAMAYFNTLELNYAKQILVIANMQSMSDYAISLLIIAFLPALIEELFFRGCVQKLLIDWTRKPLVGILITSILFSAIHISFFGFLPRVFLGMMLGYVFYYGKNIWFSILAHFINNAVAISVLYFTSRTQKLTVADLMKQEQIPYYLSAAALVVVVWLLMKLKRESPLLESQ